MLHTTHKSDMAQNFIYGTGEKCLFVYTSASNDIHDNRFEQCGVGVHFTGGSENNKFYGNSFLSNELQVKYTGLRDYEWSHNGRGNYWSDNPAFDLDGDGIADSAYRPNTLVDWVLWRYPLAKLLDRKPRGSNAPVRAGAIAHALSWRRDRQLSAYGCQGLRRYRCRSM